MGKSDHYSKSSRYRPRAKRKLKILKGEGEEDHQGKNKYAVYKDKCVICMVLSAVLVIMIIRKMHETSSAQPLPQLVGTMSLIVDELDAQADTHLITKKQHKPLVQTKGADAWQLWNVTYNNDVKLSAHSYLAGYEPSNLFAQDTSKFYVGLGYPVVLNFEFDKTPSAPIVAYRIAGHPNRKLQKQNPSHWLLFGSADGVPPWSLLDERHVGESFLSKGNFRGNGNNGVILCLSYPRTRLKSIRMKILANAGWQSQITAIGRMEFLTNKQHKHCMHKFIDQTIGEIHKNAGKLCRCPDLCQFPNTFLTYRMTIKRHTRCNVCKQQLG